ncbi:uncharacterized protein BDZ99DRAFT_448507 [Mytilinidion resinicola]|uniref:Wax synthase domain-containing protein n=1 Tax=Mytilinidion resinicola TaxID=574789 RepID=A0A6A6YDT4_9PEZI|nr:uncharacterized protein BDZ99DRAFT_448507 [Mytilinidion resinicola]KAF2806890.1 hypothetical protein BDZ99DRAFT_448507 [Mytilinidion resinicola]
MLREFPRALAILLIPLFLIYSSIFACVKNRHSISQVLAAGAIFTLWCSPHAAPVNCGAARALLNFPIAIGTMKLLDVLIRRDNLPEYTAGPKPSDSIFALILLTELRYESFSPNYVRLPKHIKLFSEPIQLCIHAAAFAVLQSLPQVPPVLAYEILLSLYIIFTSMQLLLRYKNSPPLFAPLYLIDSFSGFWAETWHNCFTAPCMTLAYSPIYKLVLASRLPKSVARVAGVLASFSFMAIFHMYTLAPLLSQEGVKRIGLFFVVNGIVTVIEVAVWGKKRHWVRAALSWIGELVIASWVVMAVPFAEGLMNLDWRGICRPREYM